MRIVSVDSLSPYSPVGPLPLEHIRQELDKLGVAVSSSELRLDPIPGNPNRHDYLERTNFRVISEGKTICLLTVGHALEPLWARTNRFAAACPGITCRPLFFFQLSDRDHLAIEFFDGRDLESLVRDRQLTALEALQYGAKIQAGLERTSQVSTHEAAAKEIDDFFAQVCTLPLFTGLDQAFLKRAVFPFVRAGALSGPQCMRWTNGDFIPRNVFVDSRQEVRLIDYEFASCTHFFAEDGWRWRTFSMLPAEARELPGFQKSAQKEPWFEAFCLLRQMILAYETNGAHMAVPDSQPALLRLREIATAAHDGFRTSVFLRPLGTVAGLETSLHLSEQKLSELSLVTQTHENALHQQAQENARLARLLQQRETKLAHIQSSKTWRTMVSLQKLRNSLSFSKRPKFHFNLDTPRTWPPYGVRIEVRGWCFAIARLQINEVRIQIGTRMFDGIYGLERADVGRAHAKHSQAYRSGFQVEVEIQPGDKTLELAVCDEHDRWHVVYCADLTKDPVTVKGSYAHWIKEYDTLTPEKLGKIRSELSPLVRQPLISIIMPVYNTPETYLTKAIDSVCAQIYDRWELCIADDASSAPHVRPLLERYASKDQRIKITFRSTNGHIAAASNSALSLASGEYIALLDHDDELRPHALGEVVKAINQNPELQLIYTDEDKLDNEGNRFDPYFKPDWMPDLLIGHNYLCHFCVCRAGLLREIGGWRAGFDGAQDWDLQFRIVERAKPDQIVHIPRILYHWRAVTGSTALSTNEKSYVVEAARRAISEHFERTGERVELIHQPGNHWRAKYALPEPAPLVSLIIPTKNGLKHLRVCIESILEKTTYPSYEILIIDNGSDEAATKQYLQRIAQPGSLAHARNRSCTVRVLSYPHPFNYSALNNFGVGEARGEFIGLLNDDLEVITADWLEEMVAQAARPGIGCVGAKLYFPDGKLQHAGVVLGIAGHAGHAFKGAPRSSPGYMNHAHLVKNYSAVTGACLIVRKSIYETVGGLDDKHLAISLNDVDLCLRVYSAGFRNLWTPFAELFHHESASRGYEDTPEKKARFSLERETLRNRWLSIINRDPAYNPNLTLDTEGFAFAYPPRIGFSEYV